MADEDDYEALSPNAGVGVRRRSIARSRAVLFL